MDTVDLTDGRAKPLLTLDAHMTRRTLIRGTTIAGVAALCAPLMTMLTACSDALDPKEKTTIDLSSEIGALNYCYALLQLEADFYPRIVPNAYPGMLVSEATAFSRMAAMTTSLRTELGLMIPSSRIADALTFRYGQIVNFADRQTVLTTAQTIAETAARAYVGVRAYVTTEEHLELIDGYTESAADRAAQVRAMLAIEDPFVPTAMSLSDAMDVLSLYYQTPLTLSHV
jgi:hypothetical protein